jgi:hypothetical protein
MALAKAAIKSQLSVPGAVATGMGDSTALKKLSK